MKPASVRIVFMGSPAFAVPSLRALVGTGYSVVAAVTQPDRPAGRGGRLHEPEVKAAASGLRIDVLQPARLRDPAVVESLRALRPDLFVVAAYGRILSGELLAIPARGAVNVHSSLLPRWRGASPAAAAILAGDPETGVSIMEMVREMDAGPVIAQRRLRIPPDATTGTLELQLAALGADLLVETLPGWLDGSTAAVPQDTSRATYCRTLTKQDGHLLATMPADEAERAVRAYQPWPDAYVVYRDQPLKVLAAHTAEGDGPPGCLTVVDRHPAIAFARGLLVLDTVQKPGKRPVDGTAFLNGERGALPERVELAP